MEKRSVLIKVIVLVILALALPALMSADTIMVDQTSCPGGSYDCTDTWIYQSWGNLQAALALWWSGYNLLICCTM